MFLGGTLVSAEAAARIRAEERSDRAAADHAADRNLIEPILGIADPRTDKRIDFVGGGRGLASSSAASTRARWRSPSRSSRPRMDDLMAVSDAGGIMPPKSTWFEPKLADGMVSHVLD